MQRCSPQVWWPTKPRLLLSGIESSTQPPSTPARTPSVSWPKTTRSASTSSGMSSASRWSFSALVIFSWFFHSTDDWSSPSELLRLFLYILHIWGGKCVSQIYLKLLDARHTCQTTTLRYIQIISIIMYLMLKLRKWFFVEEKVTMQLYRCLILNCLHNCLHLCNRIYSSVEKKHSKKGFFGTLTSPTLCFDR